MHVLWNVLLLPPSLLLLVSTSPWQTTAHNVQGEEMDLQDQHLIKRGLVAMEKLQSRPPTRVRKMTGELGEMFFLDYWGWDEDDMFDPRLHSAAEEPQPSDSGLRARAVSGDYANETISDFFLPAIRPNAEHPSQDGLFDDIFRFFQRSDILARDFSCPTNSTPCASLNRSDICCGSGENCYIGTDQGCGTVGCCPQDQTCSGPVQCCNTAAGFSNCTENGDVGSNGGCCIPNYTCYSTGCISTTVSTTVTTAPTVTVTTGSSAAPSSPSSSSSSSSSGGAAGARQTGSAPTSTTTSTASSGTTTVATGGVTTITTLNSLCPTNFYFCSAYYRPGCCIVGQDCALTNCLFATSTSTFTSNGVAIGVPVGGSTGGSVIVLTNIATGTGAATQTSFAANGACVGGFQSCAQSFGGGCCPGNFACESGPSCTAISGAGATGEIAKVQPGAAVGLRVEVLGWFGVGVGLVIGVAVVVL